MKRFSSLVVAASVSVVLCACSTTRDQGIAELEQARTLVPEVEQSPRAGVAATNIAEARKSLDQANAMAKAGKNASDVRYQADVALKNAQIAKEKIETAVANDQVEKGNAERQQVLLSARNRELQSRSQELEARKNELEARKSEIASERQRADALEEELKSLQAKKTERGLVLTLGDVLFDSGKSTLKSGAFATVDRLAQALKQSPNRKLTIEGHTDSVGTEDFNMQLSESRAQAVKSALVSRGVPDSQIMAVGKGEGFPVATNDTAAGRQQNRRVEVILSDSDAAEASATPGG